MAEFSHYINKERNYIREINRTSSRLFLQKETYPSTNPISEPIWVYAEKIQKMNNDSPTAVYLLTHTSLLVEKYNNEIKKLFWLYPLASLYETSEKPKKIDYALCWALTSNINNLNSINTNNN